MAEAEQPAPPGGRPRPPSESQPEGGDWRDDALARSQHSRLDVEIRPPEEDFDLLRATAVCAEIARGVLGDFAPALTFLPVAERRRAQALLAYGHTLFDFARQRGVEGQRLAEINRFEFTLDTALSGTPVGQPIFVGMAEAHGRRPWSEGALSALATAARRRVTRGRAATARDADADAERLAGAAAAALLGEPPAPELRAFVAALLRLHALQNLGEEARANRLALPTAEVPAEALAEGWGEVSDRGEAPADPGLLLAAARRECRRLRPLLLGAPRGLVDLPAGYRRAAVFSLLAGLRLLSLIEDDGDELLARPPHLGLVARLALLARARWFRL